jgi:hypothetical protein
MWKESTVALQRFLAFLFRRPGLQPWRKAPKIIWALAPEDSDLLHSIIKIEL